MAMSYGAPAPEDILFESRVLPATGSTEDALAPGNIPDTRHPMKPPFRRIRIDCVALPAQFTLVEDAASEHVGGIEVLAYLYSNDGRLLNVTGQTIQLKLTEANYKTFLSKPFVAHLDLSAPEKSSTIIRLAIRDVPSNRYGAIELPTADVLKLAPVTLSGSSGK